ncbi:hypothetical protein Patl1_12210 [Pistacia atlantica]|uniref:Uncharacterized protein n=2 Tax=Pistacia atlantica TaxID=434234 RepID=A0ACC1A7G7_9ROSI|nr:hypothetical protein Patl1_12230 [Pistacia atlantica]KAJ0082767.1 hypothetical protein Patl1_12210 [Pistacia atlantica]
MADLSPSPSPNCHDHSHQSQQQQSSTIDFNVTVIMVAMLCALVCALGLNSTLQCVFQCTYRVVTEPRQWLVSRRQNSGLKKKEVVALPTSTFVNNSSAASGTCAICLVDFIDGDKIRVLPKCNHRFHVPCIDKWLLSHSSCPTCRHRLKNSNHSFHSLDQIVVTP